MKIVIPIERFQDIYKKEAYAFANRLRDDFVFLLATKNYKTDNDLHYSSFFFFNNSSFSGKIIPIVIISSKVPSEYNQFFLRTPSSL